MTAPHTSSLSANSPLDHPVAVSGRRTADRFAAPAAYLVLVAVLVFFVHAILKINHGTFTYTLDDPYIHLALSDQIRHGNYGLAPGTHAAPSSSILFPVLLAVASGTGLHPYLPLLINIVCLFATVEIVRRFLLYLRLGMDAFSAWAEAAVLVLFALSFNLVGVLFTGLEHSLHIALVAATVYGAALLTDRRHMPAWLPLVLVATPLVRYEGAALSIGVVILLALLGRTRTALAVFAAMAVLLSGFSVFLKHLGLAALPSSIMVKSVVAAGGIGGGRHELFHGLMKTIDTMIGHPIGLPLLVVGVFAAARLAQDLLSRRSPWTANGLMSIPLLCLIGGQAVAGRFGWLERYEDYLLVGVFLMGLYMARGLIVQALAPEHFGEGSQHNRFITFAAMSVALLLVGSRYIHSTAQVPTAASNVYEQQLQMHRFIDGYYRGPVAVNDLGLTSYHNPYPVLDLGGLGSEKARLMIAHHATAADYQVFVAANGVHLAIVYDEWFPGQIPDGWTRVATLTLAHSKVSAAEDDVQFYATDAATVPGLRSELRAFAPTLPPGVVLEIF